LDRLSQIKVFIEVGRAGSFTAAAQRLRLSKAGVTRQISALECALGVKLLNRNTKHVSLTGAGELLAKGGQDLLNSFDSLEALVRQNTRELRGTIRLGVQPAFGATCIVPALVEFQKLYPDVNISLCLESATTDIVRDGLDMALRVVPALKSTNHISQLLVRSTPQWLVAAPSYLASHGSPGSIEDLPRHNCLVHTMKSPTGLWTFKTRAGLTSVKVSGTLSSDFGEALHTAALLGCGISMHPTFMIKDDIRSGKLKVVLPKVRVQEYSIFALHPHRNAPRRVRTLIDFLNKWLRAMPQRRNFLD
jgi:DNA-binding transcriptional LysR family regulator